jgi:hypothetical protein
MDVDGWMPMSVSSDMGKSWEATRSQFPPIGGAQRLVLMRLAEGPLFLASFAKDIHDPEPVVGGGKPPRHASKLFGALSLDDGKTWPVRRMIGQVEGDRAVDTIDGGPILMNSDSSEPLGYLSGCQGQDGVIHLITSRNHYAFNLEWLRTSAELPAGPRPRSLPPEGELKVLYDGSGNPTESSWHFVAQGSERDAVGAEGPGPATIRAGSGNGARWSNERTGVFPGADPHHGLTAEVTVQVVRTDQPDRGFDLEVYLRGGTLTVNHYLLSITPAEVFYWHDNEFRKMADGLDNSGGAHVFRMAVRDDTVFQVFRDGELLGLGKADLLIDWRRPARGSYMEWGMGGPGEAVVGRVSCDLTGAYRPTRES